MKSMFEKTISLQLRLFVAVLLSIVLILGDKYTQGGENIRTSLNTLVSGKKLGTILKQMKICSKLFKERVKQLETTQVY